MSNTKDDYFAKNFKALRDQLGLTQQQMADLIGVRKTTICNYEAAYARPTYSTIKCIMERFHLPPSFFFDDINDTNRKKGQRIFGIPIPFYLPTNIEGLSSRNRFCIDSPFVLPPQISSCEKDAMMTLAPDNSMNRCGITKGTAVVIDTASNLIDGKIFAAIRDGELIIRKYHNNSSGMYMTCESTKIPSGLSFEEIPRENFTILGIITKIISDI